MASRAVLGALAGEGFDPSAARSAATVLDLVELYSEAGPDFGEWSPAFNMHFGFFRRGLSPFRLEPMLEQMNAEVFARLRVEASAPIRLLDLGCGLGATARHIARRAPAATVTGLTIVPWQVEQARRMTREAGLEGRVGILEGDFRSLPWADETFDGVYAIESGCYGGGSGKLDFLREAARVLRPGGMLVVADGFLSEAGLGPLARFLAERVRRGWCLGGFPELGAFLNGARAVGLTGTRVEAVSLRVAPSALFAPLVACRFLWRELLVRRARLQPCRWGNVVASLCGVALGALPSGIRYSILSARKPPA